MLSQRRQKTFCQSQEWAERGGFISFWCAAGMKLGPLRYLWRPWSSCQSSHCNKRGTSLFSHVLLSPSQTLRVGLPQPSRAFSKQWLGVILVHLTENADGRYLPSINIFSSLTPTRFTTSRGHGLPVQEENLCCCCFSLYSNLLFLKWSSWRHQRCLHLFKKNSLPGALLLWFFF